MFDLKNKVVLVTGAANGIGAGVVRGILDKGAKHVAILDINTELGIALQDELRSKHGAKSVKFIKCDVTKDLDAAYDETKKEFGYIDVVINNAGIMNDAPHLYEKAIAINVIGNEHAEVKDGRCRLKIIVINFDVACTEETVSVISDPGVNKLSALIKSSLKAYNMMHLKHGGRGGTIVNISSIVALFQSYLLPVYNATKSAVLQFSNCLGAEQNFSRSGVRVVTICFGSTETNLIQGTIGGIDEELVQQIPVAIRQVPLQNVESAVRGLIEGFEKGASGSTWLVTSGRPAEDITGNVSEAYKIMSQGVYE